MRRTLASLTRSLASCTALVTVSVMGACASYQNELVTLTCEMKGALQVNDSVRDVCFCPTEMIIHDQTSYMIFTETVRPNALQIMHKAAQHPSLLPIPDYVINDEVRNFTAAESDVLF